MDEYLATTIAKLKSKEYKDLTIVIGNESCDLDSAVSSIVYATFLNWQHITLKCGTCTKYQREKSEVVIDDIFVPVLNVQRQDFCLKTEIDYFFRKIGISEENLAFRDDFDYESLLKTTNSRVVLVDHHVLAKQDIFLTPYVTEVIDHRPINKAGWQYSEDIRSTIELVGSCATLVAQRVIDLSALMSKQLFFSTYLQCAEMVYATIILDTVNFSEEVDKATPHDKHIVMLLETLMKPNNCEIERKRILDELTVARSDVTRLSASQLLRKDVKVVGDIFVPSFPILVKEFLTRPGAKKALSNCLEQNDCSTVLMLGMDLRDGLKRDVGVYSVSMEKANLLSKRLVESKTPFLKLKSEDKIEDCRYFVQDNLSASRKQYMPILCEFLNENK